MKIEVEYEYQIPNHYKDKHGYGVDTIEKMIADYGLEPARWFCLGNVYKYLDRWNDKDGDSDLNKAMVYIHCIREINRRLENKEDKFDEIIVNMLKDVPDNIKEVRDGLGRTWLRKK